MTIETHTTDRKALSSQIAELLREDAIYAGVPSYAYRVGPVTIDRSGTIHTDDSKALETLKPFLIEKGYIKPEVEPAADPVAQSAHSETQDIERMEISAPAEDLTVAALRNLIFMLYSKQYLLNRATGSELSISDGVITRLREYTPDTAEAFSELLTDFQALGELDGVDFRDGKVTLIFPFDTEQPERWAAYGFLLNSIVETARTAGRVFPKRQQPENEKYHVRSWLIRLGLGGAEFKALRSLLLRNLKGHTAFSDDAAAQRHREKYAEIRRASRGEVEAE